MVAAHCVEDRALPLVITRLVFAQSHVLKADTRDEATRRQAGSKWLKLIGTRGKTSLRPNHERAAVLELGSSMPF
jgi:hypothetical protein